MRNHRMYVLGASLLALTLFASACSDSGGDGTEGDGATDTTSAAPKGELTIGVSGAFTENQLVAEMYAQVLEADGYTVNRELELAARDVSDAALESGEIDLKPEYTGFELGFWDPKATANGEPQTVADALAEAATERGFVTYQFSPANSTNVFVTLEETATANNLTDLSSVAAVAPDLVLGAPAECPEQPFCIPGLQETYGIEFGEVRPLDQGGKKTVAAIDSGTVDVAELFSLDPVISQKGYFVLEDDMNLQANGNFVPLVREDAASAELETLLDSVTTALTDENMNAAVGAVDLEQRDLAEVATEFLTNEGII